MADGGKMKNGKSKTAKPPHLLDYLNESVVKTVFKRHSVKNSVQNRRNYEQNNGDKSAKIKPIHIEFPFSQHFMSWQSASMSHFLPVFSV